MNFWIDSNEDEYTTQRPFYDHLDSFSSTENGLAISTKVETIKKQVKCDFQYLNKISRIFVWNTLQLGIGKIQVAQNWSMVMSTEHEIQNVDFHKYLDSFQWWAYYFSLLFILDNHKWSTSHL